MVYIRDIGVCVVMYVVLCMSGMACKRYLAQCPGDLGSVDEILKGQQG